MLVVSVRHRSRAVHANETNTPSANPAGGVVKISKLSRVALGQRMILVLRVGECSVECLHVDQTHESFGRRSRQLSMVFTSSKQGR